MTRSRPLHILLQLLKWALFLTILVLVGQALFHQFRLIDWATVHFRALPVLGAILCLAAVPPIQMISYRALLAAYAGAPPWKLMPAIAWIPAMGRYLPGASVVGAVYLLGRLGISAATALGVVIAMDGIAVVVGLMIGSPLLLTPAVREHLPLHGIGPALCAAIVVAGVSCLHPRIYARLINIALRILGRPPLSRTPPISAYFIPVCCAIAQWLVAGVALWLLARSLTNISVGKILPIISVAALGYTISYLAVFAAGGLGVREGVFIAGLQPLLSPGAIAAPVVVGQRIIQTCTELAAALLGLWFYRHFCAETASAPAPPPAAAEV